MLYLMTVKTHAVAALYKKDQNKVKQISLLFLVHYQKQPMEKKKKKKSAFLSLF